MRETEIAERNDLPPYPIGRTKLVYNVDEVAGLFGVSSKTVYREVGNGTFPIPHMRIGKQIKFAIKAVHDFLDSPDAYELAQRLLTIREEAR